MFLKLITVLYKHTTAIGISALSSALGALFGASRILQAMSRDGILPILKPFRYGSKRGDEPRVGILFTWVIAQVLQLCYIEGLWGLMIFVTPIQGCVMIGTIDKVAPIATSFYCLSYACINIACFVLAAVNAPNFR